MKSALVMALLMLIWPFSSGTTYHMTASNIVPAASGTVKVQRDESSGNTKLDIKVRNLAKPTNLVPPGNVYIVWVQPNDGPAIKQGAMGIDKNLNGELKVVTVSKNFEVFITAERDPSVDMPSGVRVLQAHVNVG